MQLTPDNVADVESAMTAIKEAAYEFELSKALLRLERICPELVDGGRWQYRVGTLARTIIEERDTAGLEWSMWGAIREAANILIAQVQAERLAARRMKGAGGNVGHRQRNGHR